MIEQPENGDISCCLKKKVPSAYTGTTPVRKTMDMTLLIDSFPFFHCYMNQAEQLILINTEKTLSLPVTMPFRW